MKLLAGVAGWLTRGGIIRWLVVIAVVVLAGSVLLPHMGQASQALFGAAVMIAILLVVYRLMLGGGRQR